MSPRSRAILRHTGRRLLHSRADLDCKRPKLIDIGLPSGPVASPVVQRPSRY
jgi:hypothetical protein